MGTTRARSNHNAARVRYGLRNLRILTVSLESQAQLIMAWVLEAKGKLPTERPLLSHESDN